jgi:Tetratricopeptide repeat
VFRFLQRTDMVDVNYFEWWQKQGNLALQANDIPLALEIAEAMTNEGLKQELLRNTAMAYAGAKQWDKAVQTLDAIGFQGVYQVEAIAQLANVLYQSGEQAAGERELARALQLAETLPDAKERAQSLGSVASVMYRLGQTQSADRTLKQSLQVAEKLDDISQQTVWVTVFRSLTREEQFDPAFQLLRRYPIPEKSIHAIEQVYLGQALQREDIVLKFLPLANTIPSAKAQTLMQVAQWQLAKGQTAAFEKTMKDAVSSARRIPAGERDPMLTELVWLYARSGNTRQALRLLSRIQDATNRDRMRSQVSCLGESLG